jgi:hypothetical protein
MNWRAAFNTPPRSFDATLDNSVAASEPVFLTVQSLITFSGANIAVSAIRAIFAAIFPDLGQKHYVTALICVFIAIIIWLIGVTDPASQMMRRQSIIGLIIALINSSMLYLASEGLFGKTAAPPA